jgi:hypothetical protein
MLEEEHESGSLDIQGNLEEKYYGQGKQYVTADGY